MTPAVAVILRDGKLRRGGELVVQVFLGDFRCVGGGCGGALNPPAKLTRVRAFWHSASFASRNPGA